ncbi:MAG: polysaccharide deacetylase family protein [Acidobacteria bacterium]|nr:polysaccharide deacetylase family protein [Acidobacteriota bacterium]
MMGTPVLTIDVEEWFHVCGHPVYSDPGNWPGFPKRLHVTLRRILEILDGSGSVATFFVLGWVARSSPSLVREIVAAGHEVGCHGDEHRRIWEMSLQDFRRDLARARGTLEDVTGHPIHSFRAPEWSMRTAGNPAFTILAEEGFRVDSSLMAVPPLGPVTNPKAPVMIQTPAGPILELPPLAGTFLGFPAMMGGGWTSRFTREARLVRLIEESCNKGEFPVLYAHPWEFDPEHPRMKLGVAAQVVHFAGTSRMPVRLANLVRKIRFGNVSEAARQLRLARRFDALSKDALRGVAA